VNYLPKRGDEHHRTRNTKHERKAHGRAHSRRTPRGVGVRLVVRVQDKRRWRRWSIGLDIREHRPCFTLQHSCGMNRDSDSGLQLLVFEHDGRIVALYVEPDFMRTCEGARWLVNRLARIAREMDDEPPLPPLCYSSDS